MFIKRKVIKKTLRKRPVKKRVAKKTTMIRTLRNMMTKQLEKKHYTIAYAATDATMGQVTGNGNGFYSGEVTPIPGQNTTSSGRIGNDINITGCYMTMQLRQMSGATAPVKLTFYLLRMRGDYSSNASQVVTNTWTTSEYAGGGGIIYDTQSAMNPDFFGSFRILKKFNMYIKPDQFTGQQMPCVRNVPLKFTKPLNLRFFSGSGISSGKIFLCGFASNGNASTAVASTITNIPVTAINTGQFINFSMKWYYTDA